MTHCIECTSNVCVNDDQSATFTINVCDVSYKTLQTYFDDPVDWINTLIKDTIEIRAEELYKRHVDKLLSKGSLPVGATKKSLVLSYEHDPEESLLL